ncbi:MAG: SIMPL domain-containing protein [Rhizobiales bacterium]|nr:SIMPL domain-containing protein [Hyphomicrobiales bacterium]
MHDINGLGVLHRRRNQTTASALSLSRGSTVEYQQNTNRPRVTGYTAGHQLPIPGRDLAKLGDVLDRMVSAGANQVDDLQLNVAGLSRKGDEARAALADAKWKADVLPLAVLAHQCTVTFGQVDDEVMGMRGAGGGERPPI